MIEADLNASDFPYGEAELLIKKIQKIARQHGAEARLVGGAVRNWLMQQPVEDFDLAINIPITDFIHILHQHKINLYETGLSHGTITVVENDVSLEITQTRRDVNSDGRHSEVEAVSDWLVDSNRRDFTINAIYISDLDELFDPQNGLLDINRKKLQFIGDPDLRIQEDYLRILRAFRFLACLPAFTLQDTDIVAIKKHLHKIHTLSSERVTDELRKWISAENPTEALFMAQSLALDRDGLGFNFNLMRLQPAPAKTLFLELDWLARLAVIIIWDDRLAVYNRLRLSRLQYQRFERLMERLTKSEATQLKTKNWQRVAYWQAADLGAKARIFAIENNFIFSADALQNFDNFTKPKFPITGHHLQELGWKPGPELGKKLLELETLWVDNQFSLPSSLSLLPIG